MKLKLKLLTPVLLIIAVVMVSCTQNKTINDLENKLTEVRLKLKNCQDKYHALTHVLSEKLNAGIVINSIDGITIEANQAYLDMLGYNLDEIQKMTYQQLTPEKWHAMEQDMFENYVLKNGFCETYEKEYIRKDGTVFPIQIQAWLIYDEQGNPWRLFGVVEEIKED